MFTNTPIMYHSILSPPEMFRVRVQNVSNHDKQRALTLFATADYHLADNILNPTPIHRKKTTTATAFPSSAISKGNEYE